MSASSQRPEIHRLSLALVIAGAAGALTACGSDGIPIEELGSELEHRICARAAACSGAESVATCESTVYFAESTTLLTLVEAVKRGTVAYDGESARECLDAIGTDCADLVEPPACARTFRGTVPAGGACVTANECVNQGSCLDEPTCTDACCVGTCEAVNPPAAIGAACDILANEPCVAGAFCNNDGLCTAAGPVGSVCQGSSDACVAPAVCLYPLGGSSGTCTVISSAPGAACIPGANFGCGRADEICDAATSRCKKVASIGAACAETYECVGYAYCAAGTCTARPALGQACDNATAVYCLGDLSCTSGVCTAPAPGVACVP